MMKATGVRCRSEAQDVGASVRGCCELMLHLTPRFQPSHFVNRYPTFRTV